MNSSINSNTEYKYGEPTVTRKPNSLENVGRIKKLHEMTTASQDKDLYTLSSRDRDRDSLRDFKKDKYMGNIDSINHKETDNIDNGVKYLK
eukprot:CAMPEP_0116990768 /NCGR_PEP_ID=MMETSP0467-20121206/65697_1 /TAXON_ID=283647 /ORGANISM="Mesodinium pulex, Strain SPMC105" /LENGTH=90 /DNA_ID=CAMNT_0004687639 /DNA_START=662 /DNA_END=934 /DNA_ORIENTATION=-